MGLNLDFSLSEFAPAVETFEIAFDDPSADGSDVREAIVVDYVRN